MSEKRGGKVILVTGGAGFIGSNLVKFLVETEDVDRVINLDALTYAGHPANLREVQDHPKYAFIKRDIRDKEQVLETFHEFPITHVMHLAAESHVDRSIHGPADFIQTNVMGTFHLLEAARECWKSAEEDRRFLHVSTDEVYGSLGPEGLFTEQTPYAPNSPYSASKASSDMLVRAYHHTYGLPTVITNCSNNYGPHQFPEKLIPVVIRSLVEGRSIPVYGDGMNVRDWLYVSDHVEALWLALCAGVPGETYNIGGKNEWPNLRIVERICDLVDEFTGNPEGHSRKAITFVADRPGHDRRYAIDATKIQNELGWRARHDFASGIRETVSWYLQNEAWCQEVLKGHLS